MQGTDTSVEVPQEVTLRNATTSSFASSGVVGRAYVPSREKLAARTVSPTTSTNTRGLCGAIATRISRASVPTGSRGARMSRAPRARFPTSP